jgi:uncharacterized RDD family membrane protein YckC
MSPRPAPLWRLAAAAVADALLGVIAWSLAAMWLLVAVFVVRTRPLDLLDGFVLAQAILGLGVVFHVIYHTVLVGGCGQTVGKMLMGVAVVRRDGAPAGYGRALLRCVGGGLCLLTLGLGRVFVLFTRDHRALSDFVAGTRPITTPHPALSPEGRGRY